MKIIIKRVKSAKVAIGEKRVFKEPGAIKEGLLVYVGIERGDTEEDLDFYVRKIINLRVFDDESGRMQYSVKDQGYSVLCIPNFTLAGVLKKGNRPSFDNSADKAEAKRLFSLICEKIGQSGVHCVRGEFGAEMLIDSCSWGPVNIIMGGQSG